MSKSFVCLTALLYHFLQTNRREEEEERPEYEQEDLYEASLVLFIYDYFLFHD